jgi:HEPN domain-containing protein
MPIFLSIYQTYLKVMSPALSLQGEQAKKTMQWVAWADNEYITARQLLLTDTALVQGCILSDTAIEKYLKALLVLLGLKNPKLHKVDKLYEKIKNNGLNLNINEEYLTLLAKSYQLRYFDDLPLGFNISVTRTKMLVELDHTVFEIRNKFNFKICSKKTANMRFDRLLEGNDSVLLSKNCYYGNYDRSTLFKEQSYCYELRVLEQGILEIHYLADGINDDGKYDVEGLKPNIEINDV